MNTIYILTQGDYKYKSTVLVTTDVKQVVKKYVEIIVSDGYGKIFDNPYIEIWKNGCEEEYHYKEFHENNNNENQIVKYLSKLGREIIQ